MASVDDESLPDELEDACTNFHVALGNVEETLQPLVDTPRETLHEELEDPLDRASTDLVVAFTVNSLFWSYLSTTGVQPAGHPVKKELDRIKACMNRVTEARKKPRRSVVLNKEASKRVIRGATWTPGKEKEKSAVKRQSQTGSEDSASKRHAKE